MPKGQLQTNKAANPLVMFRIKGLMTSSLTSTQRTTWGQTDNLTAPTKFDFETPSAGGIRWRSFCHATFRKQHLGLVKQACWPRQQDARPNLNPDGSQGDPLPRIPKMWGMELFRKKKNLSDFYGHEAQSDQLHWDKCSSFFLHETLQK